MSQISIMKANSKSLVGAKLNQMALGSAANTLAGSEKKRTIENTFRKLWLWDNNRFSHQYAFEAKLGEQTLGMITCYPIPVLKRLALPTLKKILSYRKLSFIGHNIFNLKQSFSTFTLKEGHEDEFHIATLATLPESRGMGIGSHLIKFAEEQASLHGYAKCSLTVRKDNHLAAKLYHRLGFEITGEINRPAFSLYRMAKMVK